MKARRTVNGLDAGDVIRTESVIVGDGLVVREHDGALYRRMR